MKIVAYYRVSTKGQGESGLGLDAQREAVARYATATSGTVLEGGEFTEIESGKDADRPKIAEAISMAKLTGATLVVAKLDRLSRNVFFLSSLMESDVEFVCCDMPHANRLTLHIMAAMAEYEAHAISERTKAGLEQARKRGVPMGGENPKCRNLTKEGRARGSLAGQAARRKAARAFREAILPIILKLLPRRLDEVASELNRRGYLTFMGKEWTEDNVMNLIRTTMEKGRRKKYTRL